jgi:hypothetical protein
MIYGYDCWTHRSRTGPKTYHVEFWKQPARWRLLAVAYHWYDSRIHKVPGFKALERWHRKRHDGDMDYVPISCMRDIRCWLLRREHLKVLAVVEVTEEQYRILSRRSTTG